MKRRCFTKTGRLAAGACTVALLLQVSPPATAEPDEVRLLGLTTLPHALRFDGTTVGGLSGIDHDPRSGDWVLISDDRSEEQPARCYTADLAVRPGGVHVELTGTEPLSRPDGTAYPPPERGGGVDPESVRFDPWTDDLWWTSEGERARRPVDPSIRRADPDGSFEGEPRLAPNLRVREAAGPRQNQALEGLTFAAGGSLVVSSVEGPLIQDGPAPTPEHGALGRITVQDRLGHVLSQYAYPVEPVFAESPTGEFSNNGVSEILALNRWDPTRHLVMERSFVSGVGNSVRIYEIDTTGATDVRDVASLRGEPVRPVRKELLVDLADVEGLPAVDNVEGMTWGPRLPNGQRTLVLVSDDNFSSGQTTQLIALAVR